MFRTTMHSFVAGKTPFIAILMDDHQGSSSIVDIFFHIISGLTALSMVGSEIVARFYSRLMPPASDTSSTIINTIPFLTLNISIALTLVVNVILNMAGIRFGSGVQLSLILTALLVTNKKAQKHLRTRLRQKTDSIFVGSRFFGRSSRVEPVVSIAFVPVRDFRGI